MNPTPKPTVAAPRAAKPETDHLLRVLVELGQNLGGAVDPAQAARVLAQAARDLIGWDACAVNLCSRDSKWFQVVYEADTNAEGRTVESRLPRTRAMRGTPTLERALDEGAFVLAYGDPWYAKLRPFGEVRRLSQSLVFCPIAPTGQRPIGVLTIQSYTPDYYNDQILPTLEVLTGFCSATIERCRAQEDMSLNEERYRHVFIRAGLIPYERDLQTGEYSYLNEAIRDVMGYEAHEINTTLWKKIRRDFVGQGHLAGFSLEQAYDQYLRGTITTWEADLLVERRDGQLRWLHDASIIFKDELGIPRRSLGVLQDITNRKQIEEQLKARERELFSILANTRDLFARFDRNHVVLFVSPSIREMTGRTPEDYLGRPVEENYLGTPLCNLVCESLDHIFSTGAEIRREFMEAREEGKLYLQARLIPEFGEDRRVESVLLLVQNITALKMVEESLKESRGRMKILLQNMPAILWSLDRQYRFTFVSGSALETIGMKAEDFLGRTLMEVTGVHDPGEGPISEHALCMAGNAVSFEYEFHGATFQVSLEPLTNDEGEVVGAVGLGHDVTATREAEKERRRIETRIQNSQRLESLGVMAGGIAHDFNNILAGILGNAGIALMEAEQGTELHEVLRSIERAGLRAADLVRQILAYSGKAKYQITNNDLNQMIREMIELLKVSISKTATLDMRLSEGPMSVRADSSRIHQVIMNLILNASDALESGPGTITIETGRMECGPEELAELMASPEVTPGRFVYLRITDTGCGMDAETLERIFDPFFTTKFTGRGLGLAAVQGIVRGHQGILKVTTRRGAGSSFLVALPDTPATEGDGEREAAAPNPALRGDGGLILVVDDEEAIRNVLCRMLRHHGYEAAVAENGKVAVEIFRTEHQRIRAVFLDVTMPVMTGKESLAIMRALVPGVPVILMSGLAEDADGIQFSDYPVHGFLQKPFRPGEVRQMLAGVLERAGKP